MVQRITIAPQGPEFSRFVMGYWRLMDWNMSARQLVSFIEEHLDLGVTTVDHADIYGGYQCEAAFGEALKLAPHLRERMEIVSKCGIATTAREENVIGHYITDRDHIIKSAEQSLINLATDWICPYISRHLLSLNPLQARCREIFPWRAITQRTMRMPFVIMLERLCKVLCCR
ncbi:hypothetical protein BX81_22255 [Escherichia coli O165:H25 str. 2010C-4874]|nr:hypothetical protein BX81_22255 [Escherichia coli O165:H25 str. 2010C-4874]